jgi:hypothetical protein
MIWLQVENTRPSTFHETVNGSAEHVEKILIGNVEKHENGPDRYCRYVHIVTDDAELVLELYADNSNALALRTVAEDARYILDEQRKK